MTSLTNIARSKGDPKVLSSGPGSLRAEDRLARGLGWFSIGLGLAQLCAPRVLTRALGMEGREGLVRAFGARELGAGVVTLSTETRGGLQGRVIGDVLDLATLVAARRGNPRAGNVSLAIALVAGVTILDLVANRAFAARHRRSGEPARSYADRGGFPKGVVRARGVARDKAGSFRPGSTPRPAPSASAMAAAAG